MQKGQSIFELEALSSPRTSVCRNWHLFSVCLMMTFLLAGCRGIAGPFPPPLWIRAPCGAIGLCRHNIIGQGESQLHHAKFLNKAKCTLLLLRSVTFWDRRHVTVNFVKRHDMRLQKHKDSLLLHENIVLHPRSQYSLGNATHCQGVFTPERPASPAAYVFSYPSALYRTQEVNRGVIRRSNLSSFSPFMEETCILFTQVSSVPKV